MKITRLPFVLTFILAALVSLTGCSPAPPDGDSPPGGEAASPTATSGVTPLPTAAVTFWVTLPENTPSGEPIQLLLLDEITGLAINPQRHTMQAETGRVYTVTVDLPLGAVVKYRYTRKGSVTAEEHTAGGRPVRYRLFWVDGPGEVHDIITRWNDTSYNGPTGRITGRITGTATGELIPNVLVIAGGVQTLTAWDGSYLIEGLPPGTHNMVAYAMDGSYQTFQQGALIAENATTPAAFRMTPTTLVNVAFNVRVPENTTPAVPLRLAGNLYQLGNTFANLSGGISVPAARMPTLAYQEDGSYSLTLSLPAGTYVRYKYTLGDGFWNAERTRAGGVPFREVIIPPGGLIIDDEVETWSSVGAAPIWFDVTVPKDTPPGDTISIQFRPFGWTPPIPMWQVEENRWVYLLSSPLDVLGNAGYRYCRNDQCGSADDASTAGFRTSGRPFQTSEEFQAMDDQVIEWQWMSFDSAPDETGTSPGQALIREEGFIAGVEFQPAYHPSWTPRLPAAFRQVQNLGASWVILAPTWTFTQPDPLVFEGLTGVDMPWLDLNAAITQASNQGLDVAIFPTPNFPASPEKWWADAPRDFIWWDTWFERYHNFAIHHASLAAHSGAQTLILGGGWLDPALPNGFMPDGFSSGVPEDAEERWRAIIADVRSQFDGTIAWGVVYPQGLQNPPPFLDAIDQIYLLWSAPLSDQPDASTADLQADAANLLDSAGLPFYLQYKKPLVIALAYPSAGGGVTGCIPDGEEGCLPLDALARPNPNIPEVKLDLGEQLDAYSAMLDAINGRDWIQGVVSRGYYPPAALADKSTSVHGKPAENVLGFWFAGWLGLER